MASYSATHNGTLTARDLQLKAAAPLVRGDGYGAALMLSFDSTHLDIATDDAELDLYRFETMIGGGMALAPGWSLRGSVGTAYSSDLRDATWSALQYTTSAMIHHVVGPSDALVGGLVYTSSSSFIPVLPLLGYVHQRDGSPLRFDVFLPHHARVEYEVRSWLRTAVGTEVFGSTWMLKLAPNQSDVSARRQGGAGFAEVQWCMTRMLHVEARGGIAVERYTLPMQPAGAPQDQPLRASAFGQLSFVVAP
jgi:hypothetical protein